MDKYSSPFQQQSILGRLGEKPLWVVDLDGDFVEGYARVPGQRIPGEETIPEHLREQQDIPAGTSPAAIASLVEEGILRKAIFAKPADVRVPSATVRLINDLLDTGRAFSIVPLTSRGTESTLRILDESGVRHPERMALCTNSGGSIIVNGIESSLRPLSDEEKYFLGSLDAVAAVVQTDVNKIVRGLYGDDAVCPDLFVEHKGEGSIASNLHWRPVLEHYKQEDNSALDKAIGETLKPKLAAFIKDGPTEADGKPAFKVLDGPGTLEVKIAAVHKGLGLTRVVDTVLQGGEKPTSIIFAGDDIAKGNGYPGTDYDAVMAAKSVALKTGIPVFTVHTHHPVNNDLTGTQPDPYKSPATLSEIFPRPHIDLTVPTPADVNRLVLSSFGRDGEGLPPGKPLRVGADSLTLKHS